VWSFLLKISCTSLSRAERSIRPFFFQRLLGFLRKQRTISGLLFAGISHPFFLSLSPKVEIQW